MHRIVVIAGMLCGCSGGWLGRVPDAAPDAFTFLATQPAVVVGGAEAVEYEVPVTNRTGSPVRFGPLECECGCSDGARDKDSLGPGETAVVRLRVKTHGRTGPQRFACHWYDEDNRRWTAGIKVEMLSGEAFSQPRTNLGKVRPGESHGAEVTFVEHAADPDGLPPEPVFHSSDGDVRFEVGVPTVVRTNGRVWRRETPLKVTVVPSDRVGFRGVTLMNTRQLSGTGRAACDFEWRVFQGIRVSPSHVTLIAGQNGDERRLSLRADDGQPFAITAVSSNRDEVVAAIPDDPVGGGAPAVERGVSVKLGKSVGDAVVRAAVTIVTTHTVAKTVAVEVVVIPARLGGVGRESVSHPGR